MRTGQEFGEAFGIFQIEFLVNIGLADISIDQKNLLIGFGEHNRHR